MNNILKKDWKMLCNQIYKAHIADVDGNLTETTVNATKLSPLVIQHIQKRLNANIPFGICSARSFSDNPMLISIRDDILNNLDDKQMKYFFIFPEQGACVIQFKKDKNKKLTEKEIDLVKYFRLKGRNQIFKTLTRKELFQEIVENLSIQDTLIYKGDKKYGFIAQLNEQELVLDKSHQDKILSLTRKMADYVAKKHPLFEVLCTRKSIYVTLKGANKALAIRYFLKKYALTFSEIVGTDDQGTKEGVGFPLICHEAGFSTNIYEKELQRPFPVPLICKKTGVDAWFFLEQHLTYKSPYV